MYIDRIDSPTGVHHAFANCQSRRGRQGRTARPHYGSLSKTTAVERAVDSLLREAEGVTQLAARLAALLEQFDRIPDRAEPHNPLVWDERGLPA
jgi:hypothetical protein